MSSRTPSSLSGSRRSAALHVGFLAFLAACEPVEEGPPVSGPLVEAVDPFIATGGPGYRVGSSHPGATVPFGMVKVGPDTSASWGGLGAYHCSGYYYDDTHIEGFSHFRMHGTGVPDYGNILFMPTLGWDPDKREEEGYRTEFSHDDEWAEPGVYGVTLANGIEVTLAATRHAAQHRYTFPADAAGEPVVLIDLEHNLFGSSLGGEITVDLARGTVAGKMINSGSFNGEGFPIWFFAVFDEGIASFGTWADDEGVEGRAAATGIDLGAWIVPVSRDPSIRVAISLTGPEGARANLEAELGPQAIEGTAADAWDAWEAALDRVEIDGATDTERAIFATAMYHALQMPQEHGDADGRYASFDGTLREAEGWTYHNDFSLWDTYRTAHPLYNLLYREKSRDFARSLLAMAEEGGAFPAWPVANKDSEVMLGAPADIVLADTWVKGVTDWDMESAWPRLFDQAMGIGSIPYNARPDVPTLERYGYYPSDLVGASVAWTQENAWADHALAQLAQSLGESDAAAHFAWRSYTWRNQYDPAVGFFHARLSDGTFAPFNEFAWAHEYTEGNSWQYLWMGWFQPDALADVLGGRDAALARLDTFFVEAEKEGVLDFPQTYYWHGNEPDIHAAWLFALWGDRDATWKWVRWIAENHYAAAPVGLAGNDDAGTLSAWYVFAAMGFYPIAGTTTYVVSAPLFEEVRFDVAGGEFTTRRIGSGDHIVEVRLNGRPLTGATFQHREIVAGGTLEVVVE
jgi:predicted alpha-1,2-mannosidase